MGWLPWMKHSAVIQMNPFELQGSGPSVRVRLILGSMDKDVRVDSGIWNSSTDCRESVLALAAILICSEEELDERVSRFPDPWFQILTGTGSEISKSEERSKNPIVFSALNTTKYTKYKILCCPTCPIPDPSFRKSNAIRGPGNHETHQLCVLQIKTMQETPNWSYQTSWKQIRCENSWIRGLDSQIWIWVFIGVLRTRTIWGRLTFGLCCQTWNFWVYQIFGCRPAGPENSEEQHISRCASTKQRNTALFLWYSPELIFFASAKNFYFRLEVSIPVMCALYDPSDSLLPELETVFDPNFAYCYESGNPFTVHCHESCNPFLWLDARDAYHFVPLGFRARSVSN